MSLSVGFKKFPGHWRIDLSYLLKKSILKRNCLVVLKTCNEFILFISVIPSEIRWFKFTVSWLCDDHTAADTFVVKSSRQRTRQPPLRAVEGLLFPKIDMIFIAFRELIGDSRMWTAIGPRSVVENFSRTTCQIFDSPIPSAQRFPVW
jgi:hypothetical protein